MNRAKKQKAAEVAVVHDGALQMPYEHAAAEVLPRQRSDTMQRVNTGDAQVYTHDASTLTDRLGTGREAP